MLWRLFFFSIRRSEGAERFALLKYFTGDKNISRHQTQQPLVAEFSDAVVAVVGGEEDFQNQFFSSSHYSQFFTIIVS